MAPCASNGGAKEPPPVTCRADGAAAKPDTVSPSPSKAILGTATSAAVVQESTDYESLGALGEERPPEIDGTAMNSE